MGRSHQVIRLHPAEPERAPAQRQVSMFRKHQEIHLYRHRHQPRPQLRFRSRVLVGPGGMIRRWHLGPRLGPGQGQGHLLGTRSAGRSRNLRYR